jgi:hypothetical protein
MGSGLLLCEETNKHCGSFDLSFLPIEQNTYNSFSATTVWFWATELVLIPHILGKHVESEYNSQIANLKASYQ